jgi:DNA-binding transcriptional regulator YiaG
LPQRRAAVTPIEQRSTVRRVKLVLTPRTFGPSEVKRIRAMVGVSQPIFSEFLGIDVNTVRSWEQGAACHRGWRRSRPLLSTGKAD